MLLPSLVWLYENIYCFSYSQKLVNYRFVHASVLTIYGQLKIRHLGIRDMCYRTS